jgi:predicted DNA-binding protein (MmcQ/YjbR family)
VVGGSTSWPPSDFWKALALQRIHQLLRPGGVLRLWDVAFSFEPAEAEERIEAWCSSAGCSAVGGWTRGELEEQVRDEHSTFTWAARADDRAGRVCHRAIRAQLRWDLRQVRPAPSLRLAMSPEELRGHCLSFPGAQETFPFGPENSVFKVAGRIFALTRLAEIPLRVSLKCEPSLAEQLRDAHAAVIPGYHLNKRHWNTVIIDGSLPDEMVADMVEDSYDLIVSKLSRARRRALGWSSDD